MDSTEPIKEQADQLRSYIKQFPAEGRQEWYMHLSIIIDGIDRTMPVRENIKRPVHVAITSSKRFHLTAHGIRVVLKDLLGNDRGFAVPDDDGYTIVINNALGPHERLQTLDHELDHIKRGDHFDPDYVEYA